MPAFTENTVPVTATRQSSSSHTDDPKSDAQPSRSRAADRDRPSYCVRARPLPARCAHSSPPSNRPTAAEPHAIRRMSAADRLPSTPRRREQAIAAVRNQRGRAIDRLHLGPHARRNLPVRLVHETRGRRSANEKASDQPIARPGRPRPHAGCRAGITVRTSPTSPPLPILSGIERRHTPHSRRCAFTSSARSSGSVPARYAASSGRTSSQLRICSTAVLARNAMPSPLDISPRCRNRLRTRARRPASPRSP